MVAPINSNTPKRLRYRAGGKLLTGFLLAVALASDPSVSYGQNLKNTGQITNNGTFRVKGSAAGLPTVIDGRFEYFGANQTIMPRQYNSLILSGSGTKTMAAGTVTISDTLKIATGVTLSTVSGFTMNLVGRLVEQGYLSGSILKTVDLSGATTSSAFGDIGATISWTGSSPGITTVTRTSGTPAVGLGKQSILRYYDIAPTFSSPLDGSFTFRYAPNELNGRDPNSLELWRSIDGGATWRRQGGTNLPVFNAIVKTGIVSFSRWTASDTSNLLGPAAYEWVAYSISADSGDGQSGPTGGTLSPLVVSVTDYFGNSISGVPVTFVIDSIPSGATGQALSATNVTTDANGKASAALTLGNQSGGYRVRASSGSLIGSPRYFFATATTSAASIVRESGNVQRDTIGTTLAPFVVRVSDVLGNPVAGVSITFGIDTIPLGASGAALSNNSAQTNGLGIAGTSMRLGNKVGQYVVSARTSVLSDTVRFTATATPGAAMAMRVISGTTTQQDTILSVLDSSFVVRVDDRGNNGVPNASVQFAIVSAPSPDGSLSVTNVQTDSTGRASTRLTLGSKVGIYQVMATSGNLTRTFAAQALRGAPARLVEVAGFGQRKVVRNILDTAFTARVTDVGGNGIPNAAVYFSIESVPTGATGQGLSALADTTDVNGEASTILTLGTKTGKYVVTATTPVLAGDTTRFEVKALADIAVRVDTVSGGGQVRPTGSVLQPFIVTLSDVFGNAVPGDTVRFAVTPPTSLSKGYTLTPALAITDSLGQAQTTLLLGDYPGSYITTATIAGLPAIQFTATATVIMADVNRDFDVNIADLTSIIDHILGRRALTGIDSVKADVNADGAIDIRDAVALRNGLLALSPLPKIARLQGVEPATSSIGGQANTVIAAEIEITPIGTRLNIANSVPIKGIQLYIRLKTVVNITGPELIFERAKSMEFFVNSQASELYLVSYSVQNLPIEAGSGSIVRLPIRLADTTLIDSAYAIVSTPDTSFDVAVRTTMSKKLTTRPTTFSLSQNYPNPFNPTTTIEYDVPEIAGKIPRMAIQIFNILGQKVKTIERGEKDAGHYSVVWDGRGEDGVRVPTGVYFYRLLSQDFATTKKMILIK